MVGAWLIGCGRTDLDASSDFFDEGGSSGRGGSSPQGGVSTGTAGRATGGGTTAGTGTGGKVGGGGKNSGGKGNVPIEGGAPNPEGGFGGAEGGEPNGGSNEGGAGGVPTDPNAVEMALGAFHSCARFDDASLRCWGSGGYIGAASTRDVGDDEFPSVLGDVRIGKVTDIAAGWYVTCAILQGGKLRCFGNGLAGVLGHGNVDDIGDDETPASAGDVDVGGKVLQVSVAPHHACVVLEGGSVRCWGRNEYYQRGTSNSAEIIGDDETPASADPVDVGGTVLQVAAGLTHTCVLLDNGSVRCWGKPLGGSLGYGNNETVGDDETPASAGDVDVGGKAKQIVVGTQHSCALLQNGKVRCWGRNDDGRLGYGNTDHIGDDETPASAGDVDVGGKVQKLAAGDFSTCALLESGSVRCWGAGTQGELGYGNLNNVGDDEFPAPIGSVNVGGTVTDIDVGFLHVCATLDTGAVRCWGRGTTAALGYGNTNDIGDNEVPSSAGDVPVQ